MKRRRRMTPETKAKIAAGTRKYWVAPDAHEQASERMTLIMSSPELRRHVSERTKAAMARPEVRERISRKTPEVRAKISEAVRAALSTPEMREKISRRTKEGMAARVVQLACTRELQDLRNAWTAAGDMARRLFIDEVSAGADGDAE